MASKYDKSELPVLAIVIPVFNWDIRRLLDALVGEIDGGVADRVEVIVVDDASSDAALRDANHDFLSERQRPYLVHEVLGQNLGRSSIRNLLAQRTSSEFLLFLDCDVLPDSPDFLRRYLEEAEKGEYDVVCGGISYRTRILNEREYDYHAYLGSRKEAKPAVERNREPWRFLLTSNIMVRKSVFQATPFDERFTGYGYEDVEWGLRLARDYQILHIDNTASHLGLVTKTKAYEKMRASVGNYLLMREISPDAFRSSVVGNLAVSFTSWSRGFLQAADRLLKRLFLTEWMGMRLSFLFFQLDFAVLLALALNEKKVISAE